MLQLKCGSAIYSSISNGILRGCDRIGLRSGSFADIIGPLRLSIPKIVRLTSAEPAPASVWFQRGVAAHGKREFVKALFAWTQASALGDAEI